MLKKFVSYQNVLLTDTLTLVPQEFREFYHSQLSSNQDHVIVRVRWKKLKLTLQICYCTKKIKFVLYQVFKPQN